MVKRIFLILLFGVFGLSCASVFSADFNFLSRETMTLKARKLDVVDVLQQLSEKGEFNISISNKVAGDVTLFLRDITVDEAFKIVLKSADLAVEKEDGITYVMTHDEFLKRNGKNFADQTEMQVFKLENAEAGKVGEVLTEVASSDAKIVSDKVTNTIVLFDKAKKLKSLSDLVDKLDKTPSVNEIEVANFPVNKREYYMYLQERIKESIPTWYFKSNNTKVKVMFTLSHYGELLSEPEMLTFSVNKYWQDLAVEVVKESAPFAPFPQDMPQKEETFEIELAL